MAGHKANRNNIPRRNPEPTATRMTAVLDQLATDANTQRRDDPAMVALETQLRSLYAEYKRLCGHLDDVTAGAAILVVGQLLAAHINVQADSEAKLDVLVQLPNLMRLVGAQLYSGTTTDVQIACPFSYLSGAQCKTSYSAATKEHAELLMRGHAWQNHPGETWPPAEDGEGRDGDAADAVNLAPTDPEAQAAATADLEAEFPDEVISDSAHPGWSSGLEDLGAAVEKGELLELPLTAEDLGDAEPPQPPEGWRDITGVTPPFERTEGRQYERDEPTADGEEGGPDLFGDPDVEAMVVKYPENAPQAKSKHAPHELCDCRPGEVYHCAAVSDGEVEG